jgi:hypothetical protein
VNSQWCIIISLKETDCEYLCWFCFKRRSPEESDLGRGEVAGTALHQPQTPHFFIVSHGAMRIFSRSPKKISGDIFRDQSPYDICVYGHFPVLCSYTVWKAPNTLLLKSDLREHSTFILQHNVSTDPWVILFKQQEEEQ